MLFRSMRPQIVALNKIDLADEEKLEALRERLEGEGYEVFELSAPIHEGTDELLKAIAYKLQQLPNTILYEKPQTEVRVYKLEAEPFRVEKIEDGFSVEGPWIEELMRSINFTDTESLQYFQKQLRVKGVIDALEALGVKEGDTIEMGDLVFDFVF